ncbi:Innexin inx2 [Amphibalanus amphitrite]|uniref:Innexin n=1 Tax=Amphibalanus amphitrite TaxID=1232801 RepID=A0A6A4V817_AMPAM|nr:innexin inx2-like [Amphibalanus amphitrite]KAF0289299.1 Innexin inx2 [Amphibalanus amphitrite]
MLDILKSVKGVLKPEAVCIDNNVFRLHYKGTTALLLVCCLLVTSKQYLGDPIDCIFDGVKDKEKGKAMDTYCWIHSTFTVQVPPNRTGKIGEQFPYPGVVTPQEGDKFKHHLYYQWVAFTLFFQAMLFYVPHYLWQVWEGQKCQMLVMDMQSPVTKEEARRDRQKLITNYFSLNLHHHNFYAVRFFCCEVLNFLNVIAQIFFTDLFLGYEFTTYGWRVVQFANMDQEDRPDPMALVFPKMTKCTFHKYGASGTVQRIDGLCVLPLNIINEKIYIMLWFWFIVLSVLTGLVLLYRIAQVFHPQLRLQLLMVRARLASHHDVAIVARKCQIGDWFVLYQMGKNMDPIAFKELIGKLAMRFEGKDTEE